jgi:hypothetical protein
MAEYEEYSIDQGTDWALQLELTKEDGSPKNLNGYTLAAKLKKSYNSVDSDDIADFTCVIETPPTAGVATISLTNVQTDALTARKNYVYDVELSYLDSDSNTIIERLLEGKMYINPSVTRQ